MSILPSLSISQRTGLRSLENWLHSQISQGETRHQLWQRWLMSYTRICSGLPNHKEQRDLKVETSLKVRLVNSGVKERLAEQILEVLFIRCVQIPSAMKTNEDDGELKLKRKDNDLVEIGTQMVTFTLSQFRYEMLFVDYSRTVQSPGRDPESWNHFLACLFHLLCIYDGLGMNGLQNAIPHKTFEILQKYLGTDTELFASPLNHWFPSYHSAFPESDRWFGSRGNLFAQTILEGSYECNPPFLKEIIDPLVSLAHGWFKVSEERRLKLTITFIVPQWEKSECITELERSPYRICSTILHSHQHHFLLGNHWQQPGKMKNDPVPFNTLIIIWQTKEAAKHFPISDEFLNDLHKSFQH